MFLRYHSFLSQFIFCFMFFCGKAHIISPNESYADLALFDPNQTIMILEDGLDEWHEKYVKIHIDPRHRILEVSSGFTQDQLRGGGWVIYAFIVYYMFLGIYMLYKKFLHHVIEDLVYLIDYREDVFRPIVYCVLNSMSFLFLCFIDVFDTQTNFAVATVLGSDAINIFFIFGYILFRHFSEESNIDHWLYFRDILYYLLGVGLLTTFFMLEKITWYFSLILVAYYAIFYIIQSKNETVKDSIYKLLGFTHEDDSFNADEHFQYKKRRDSVTFLKENNYIDRSDQTLQKKLNRTEAILKINFKDNHKKYKVYANFQKLVYITMYAIRNKHKSEKIQRSQYYHNLHSKQDRKDKEPTQKDDQMPQENKGVAEMKPSSQNNMERPMNGLNPVNDNMPLLNQGEPGLSKPQPMINNLQKFDSYEERAKNEDAPPPNESNNLKNLSDLNNEGVEKKVTGANGTPMLKLHNNNNEEEEEEEEEINFKWPLGFWNQICYIVLFPINVCLFILPNYKKNPTPKKLAFSLLVNLVILAVMLFFISRWLQVVAFGVKMNEQTMGMIFCALGLSFPFMKYNFKLANSDKDVDFMQSFLQLGIYKIGICVGLSWLFGCIVFLSNNLNISNTLRRFGIVEAINAGVIVFSLLVTLMNKLKLSRGLSYIYIMIFIAFVVASISVLETD